MFLDVSQALKNPGEEIAFSHRDEIPPQTIFGEEITFDQVVMTGFLSMVEDQLRLRGRLKTVAHGHCAGCLKPVAFSVDVPFDETFVRVDHVKNMPMIQTDEEDEDERLAFEGSKVDLHQLALTLTVLELPMRFVCEPECDAMKIARREYESHACQKELPDQHPFSALQQLLTKDQEV